MAVINLLKQGIKRIRKKGLLDTLGYVSNITLGLIDYYVNPFSCKKKQLSSPDYQKVRVDLEASGVNCVSYNIDAAMFHNWLKEAGFPNAYSKSYGRVFVEKALEHYISADLLQLGEEDVFIDVAAHNSPWFEIAERIYGCKTYALDLHFLKGIDGNKIGAYSTAMPLPNGFATKMALHCAYECFEGDADKRFLPEAARVLRAGGKMIILPLYMHHQVFYVESAPLSDRRRVDYDGAQRVWSNCVIGDRFSRRYNVDAFMERVIRSSEGFSVVPYYIENEKDISPSCYCKFAVLFQKSPQPYIIK